MSDQQQAVSLAKEQAAHAFSFLRETGSLVASLTFFISQRIGEQLVDFRFPAPWSREREITVTTSPFADAPENILNEARLEADTVIHAHTPFLSAWSLAHRPFPILYVAAQRHLLAREIPVHLERRRSVLDVIRQRLDDDPQLAPPPGLLESNGGANFWGRGIIETARLILLIEESAKIQAIAGQLGGAQPYTPGALDLQWKRTGLLDKSRSYKG